MKKGKNPANNPRNAKTIKETTSEKKVLVKFIIVLKIIKINLGIKEEITSPYNQEVNNCFL